ncbi:MAG: hypothetical protein BIFFINMI_00954 [Phycisphaerae bacterium]|nr:hypothetical protein [Phycisphaerae bacterium]
MSHVPPTTLDACRELRRRALDLFGWLADIPVEAQSRDDDPVTTRCRVMVDLLLIIFKTIELETKVQ